MVQKSVFLAASSYKQFFFYYTGAPAGGIQDCGQREKPLDRTKF